MKFMAKLVVDSDPLINVFAFGAFEDQLVAYRYDAQRRPAAKLVQPEQLARRSPSCHS
jgi:hypothetical protein